MSPLSSFFKGFRHIGFRAGLFLFAGLSFGYNQTALRLQENGTFQMRGLSVLAFHNSYPEEHQGGIEIIQHDQRIMTNGDIHLKPIPGQWDPLPMPGERELVSAENRVVIPMRYKAAEFDYRLEVQSKGNQIVIRVYLDKPLPGFWAGKAGFHIEFFPGLYAGKSWMMDLQFGMLAHQANGPVFEADGEIQPFPLATGYRLIVAAEDRERQFVIESSGQELILLDSRIADPNGWYIVRSVIPENKSGKVIEWTVTPNVIEEWMRRPAILHSQVGYHPDQEKRILLEMDPNANPEMPAILTRIDPDGVETVVMAEVPRMWGDYLRYRYSVFDITNVRQPGVYRVQYEAETSSIFRIDVNLFSDVWQPTLAVFFPVQMCHMQVHDRYRVWHGACHLDDALQAPSDHRHHEGYCQGPETETLAVSFQHIDGLNQGGWHDAGNYGLAAGSQINTVYTLALAREQFGAHADETTVDQANRLVRLHRPDGRPDILQQIEHGVLNILNGYRIQGYCFPGIISGTIQQILHRGDAMTLTDNVVWSDSVATADFLPGTMDDRWVFTTRSTALDYAAAQSLTAASRVLRGYNDALADECLETALKTWVLEQQREPELFQSTDIPGNPEVQDILATVELFLTTQDLGFVEHLKELKPLIDENITETGWSVCRILPFIEDEVFADEISQAVQSTSQADDFMNNPFNVDTGHSLGGIAPGLENGAMKHFFLHRAFPDQFEKESVYRVMHYMLGCHPGSSTSLVSGVGTHSLMTAYGANRADWSYIPGGVVSGPNLIKPDFPELKESWPFLRQQTEYVMPEAAEYLFCVLATDWLLQNE